MIGRMIEKNNWLFQKHIILFHNNEQMKVEEIAIEKLIPYERNNKIHDEEQINRIANSIKEFWFTQPIVIDKSNIIIIWHWRLEWAKKLWMDKVPCVRLENLSDKQVKKLRILDNKLNESEYNLANLKSELDWLWDFNFWDLEFSVDDLFPEFETPEFDESYFWSGESSIDWEKYSATINTPIYTPLWIDVWINDMMNCDKQRMLESRINKAWIEDQKLKDFLIKCSYRFIEFNYKNIAEYYSNAPKEIQELMEDLALVIIDFNKAIEDWYAHLKLFLDDIAEQDDE